MSRKNQTPATVPTFSEVDYATIGWIHADNTRASSSDLESPLGDLGFSKERSTDGEFTHRPKSKDHLVFALYGGWDTSSGVVNVISVKHAAALKMMTESDVLAQVKASRDSLIAQWDAKDETRPLAILARELWREPPQYIAVDCHRRSIGIMGAIHRRRADGVTPGCEYPVPIAIRQFASWADRIEANIRENCKETGRKAYAPLDYLRQACMIAACNGRQSHLQAAYGSSVSYGTIQKVWAVARLDRKFPELKIQDRCGYKVDNPLFIDLGRLDKEECRRLAEDAFPFDRDSTPGSRETTPPLVEEYFAAKMAGGKDATVKMMNGKEVGNLKDGASKVVRLIAAAIAKNDTAFFARLQTVAGSPACRQAEDHLIECWGLKATAETTAE